MSSPDLFSESNAVISDCGLYRYLLRRVWDQELPRALFIMLNPSTADASVDDATIRSCIRLCRAMGYGGFEVVNLYGWRATDPDALLKAPDPIGPSNDSIISAAVNRCDTIICAWGAHPLAARRSTSILSIVRRYRPAAFCLGTTQNGAPKHPLYIKTGTTLVRYLGKAGEAFNVSEVK